MWNGAGSVSPAGKACDWVGPCHCESCVAKRGYVVQRTAESEVANVLTQERAKLISDLLEEQIKLAYYNGVLNEYRLMAERYAAMVRFEALRHSILWGSL